jgi:hypothetical protein
MSWRLIYNTNKVISLFESDGVTYTSKELFISNNLEDCFNKIDELEYYYKYPKGDTQVIIFSGGTRTIEDINDF